MEDLHLIRFWLRAISNACFQRVEFGNLFNPELLGLLFPPSTSSSPVQFRATESLIFNPDLPPLAYGPLVWARAVEFNGLGPLSVMLQLACSFAMPPRRVKLPSFPSLSFSQEQFFKV
jgi:hypothetical protein